MVIYSFLISAGIGIITGFLYGLFFLLSRRRVFCLQADTTTPNKRLAFSIISVVARISLLSLLWLYLLRSSSIDPILVLITFIGSFWFLLLTYKAT